MRIIIFTGLLIFSGLVSAELVTCNTKTTFTIVEAERKTDPRYTDTFLIKFINASGELYDCAGAKYAYIENSLDAHDSIVSMAYILAAQEKMATIRVESEDKKGAAVKIEYIHPKQ